MPDPDRSPEHYRRRRDVSVWRVPGMLALTLVTVAGFGGYAALFSVAPLWVVHGGQGSLGAGLVTGVLLLATVATQPLVPPVLRRFGHGPSLAAAMLLLGVPSLCFGLSDHLTPVLVLSAIRGVGFGILTVTGSVVVAQLVPVARRGEAVGVYGLGVAVPNLLLLPSSVAVAERIGFWWVFVIGAVPLLGIPAAFRLSRALHAVPGRSSTPRPEASRPAGLLSVVLPPTVVLFAVTLAGGALMTFLPQLTGSTALSVTALLVLGLVAALSRWLVGRVADRHGAARMLAPLLMITAAGLLLTVLALAGTGQRARPGLLVAAMAVAGLGYGALQNLTLLAAFSRVETREYGAASAIWNVGFDAGTGFGAVLVGVIAAGSSFGVGFLVTAALALLALPLTRARARPGV
ncbi:MAG: MFS transporter [Nocardioidaceae bacterium]